MRNRFTISEQMVVGEMLGHWRLRSTGSFMAHAYLVKGHEIKPVNYNTFWSLRSKGIVFPVAAEGEIRYRLTGLYRKAGMMRRDQRHSEVSKYAKEAVVRGFTMSPSPEIPDPVKTPVA